LIALAVACIWGGNARAGWIEAEFVNATPSLQLTVQLLGDGQSGITTQVGKYNWDLEASGNNPVYTPTDPFSTFCIELTQHIRTGNDYIYEVTSDIASAPQPGNAQGSGNPGGTVNGGEGMGSIRANMIQELADKFYADVGVDAVKAAAFQLALWEIIFEDQNGNPGPTPSPLSVTNGNGDFYIESSSTSANNARNQANTWLSQLNGGGSGLGNYAGVNGQYQYNLYALVSDNYKYWDPVACKWIEKKGAQDQIIIVPKPSNENPVPAPAGIVLALTGVPFLLGFRRFRARRAG
jgi:hypothetical protein